MSQSFFNIFRGDKNKRTGTFAACENMPTPGKLSGPVKLKEVDRLPLKLKDQVKRNDIEGPKVLADCKGSVEYTKGAKKSFLDNVGKSLSTIKPKINVSPIQENVDNISVGNIKEDEILSSSDTFFEESEFSYQKSKQYEFGEDFLDEFDPAPMTKTKSVDSLISPPQFKYEMELETSIELDCLHDKIDYYPHERDSYASISLSFLDGW